MLLVIVINTEREPLRKMRINHQFFLKNGKLVKDKNIVFIIFISIKNNNSVIKKRIWFYL